MSNSYDNARRRRRTTASPGYSLKFESLEGRRMLSANDAGGATESHLSELDFGVWAADGSSATLSSDVKILGGMNYDVGVEGAALAMLRGTYPETLFPHGIDLSNGIEFDLASNTETVLVVFIDVNRSHRTHWVTDISADQSSSVHFTAADFTELQNIRSIDFAVIEKGDSGQLHVTSSSAPEDAPSQEDTTSPLQDLTFNAWSPEGSSATLSLNENTLARLDYATSTNPNAMAMLRGTFVDNAFPQGADLSEGVELDLRADAELILIVFKDVNGNTRVHRISGVTPNTKSHVSFNSADFEGLANIRNIDFAIVESGVSGSIRIDPSAGDAVLPEDNPDPDDEPVDSDPPVGNETSTEAGLADLIFGTWAPEGSAATLSTSRHAISGMDYNTSTNANGLALLRGTYPANLYPDGVAFPNGIDLGIRSRSERVLVVFKDIFGASQTHWVTDVSHHPDSFTHIAAEELEKLGNIRSIDFAVVETGASGSLLVVPQDPCTLDSTVCVRSGDEASFRQTMSTAGERKVFYIYPDVELNGLDIVDRSGDQIHFLEGSTVVGNVQTPGHWTTDRGVINITNSSHLVITGLNAANEFLYQSIESAIDVQSSTALNISWSHNIQIKDATLVGNGKSTVWIQGNSDVELTDTTVDCYYFCVGIAASDVKTENLTISQYNPIVTSDKHAAFWISSTMRAPVDNAFYGNSNVIFEDTIIHKKTGEGMVVGNGGYDYSSQVVFRGTTEVFPTHHVEFKTDAWLPIHGNYNGITVHLEGDYPLTTVDLATTPNTFGKFLIHTFGNFAPRVESPLVVCIDTQCVTSNEVLGL